MVVVVVLGFASFQYISIVTAQSSPRSSPIMMLLHAEENFPGENSFRYYYLHILELIRLIHLCVAWWSFLLDVEVPRLPSFCILVRDKSTVILHNVFDFLPRMQNSLLYIQFFTVFDSAYSDLSHIYQTNLPPRTNTRPIFLQRIKLLDPPTLHWEKSRFVANALLDWQLYRWSRNEC